MIYDRPTEMRAMFAQYKQIHTFATFLEAEIALERFLKELRSDTYIYGKALRDLVEQQCSEALEDARRVPFPDKMGEFDTCEWHIDPVGTALELRRYNLAKVQEEDIIAHRGSGFPCDYTPYYLGLSRTRDTVTLTRFKEELSIKATYHARELLQKMPQQAYTGSIEALSSIRIAEGALLYRKGSGGLLAPDFWPRMTATKAEISLL